MVTPSFGEVSYWDEKQDGDETVDWYAEFETIRPLIQKHLQYSDTMLVLGSCRSAERLYDSGYRGVTFVDFSCSRLAAARRCSESRSSLIFQLADISTGLPYQHYPYNAILDKGTVDCLLCRETGEQDAQQAVHNIFNNLKSSGTFIMLSHGTPNMRLPLLQAMKWESIQMKVLVAAASPCAEEGSNTAMLREYSSQVPAPEQSSYVYICKKPYCLAPAYEPSSRGFIMFSMFTMRGCL